MMSRLVQWPVVQIFFIFTVHSEMFYNFRLILTNRIEKFSNILVIVFNFTVYLRFHPLRPNTITFFSFLTFSLCSWDFIDYPCFWLTYRCRPSLVFLIMLENPNQNFHLLTLSFTHPLLRYEYLMLFLAPQ